MVKMTFVGEEITKDEWENDKKLRSRFEASYDATQAKSVERELSNLFKRLSHDGKGGKTIYVDAKPFPGLLRTLGEIDKMTIAYLESIGCEFGKTDAEKAMSWASNRCVMNGNEKKPTDVLSSRMSPTTLSRCGAIAYKRGTGTQFNRFDTCIPGFEHDEYGLRKIGQLSEKNAKLINETAAKMRKEDVEFGVALAAGRHLDRDQNTGKLVWPEMKQLAPFRFPGMRVCFTRDPRLVASQSTKQGWTSCMNLDGGGYNEYVGSGASAGVFVAYFVGEKSTEDNLMAKGRVLFKPFVDVLKEAEIRANGGSFGHVDILWLADMVYPQDMGKSYSALKAFAEKLVDRAQDRKRKVGRYVLANGVYADDVERVWNAPASSLNYYTRMLAKRPDSVGSLPRRVAGALVDASPAIVREHPKLLSMVPMRSISKYLQNAEITDENRKLVEDAISAFPIDEILARIELDASGGYEGIAKYLPFEKKLEIAESLGDARIPYPARLHKVLIDGVEPDDKRTFARKAVSGRLALWATCESWWFLNADESFPSEAERAAITSEESLRFFNANSSALSATVRGAIHKAFFGVFAGDKAALLGALQTACDKEINYSAFYLFSAAVKSGVTADEIALLRNVDKTIDQMLDFSLRENAPPEWYDFVSEVAMKAGDLKSWAYSVDESKISERVRNEFYLKFAALEPREALDLYGALCALPEKTFYALFGDAVFDSIPKKVKDTLSVCVFASRFGDFIDAKLLEYAFSHAASKYGAEFPWTNKRALKLARLIVDDGSHDAVVDRLISRYPATGLAFAMTDTRVRSISTEQTNAIAKWYEAAGYPGILDTPISERLDLPFPSVETPFHLHAKNEDSWIRYSTRAKANGAEYAKDVL